jgi:hypothetical protein
MYDIEIMITEQTMTELHEVLARFFLTTQHGNGNRGILVL